MKNIDEYTTTVDLLEGDTNENSSDMKYHIQMFDIDDMNSPSALVVLRTEDDGANQVVINKSATIGFSAGGHLAAMSGILWKEDIIKEYINTNLMNAKPNGVILCYPVVSGRICSERINAFDYLLGKENINQYDGLSLENRVDKDSVPAFIWHTFTDVTVPVQSAIVLAEAYNKAGVKFELHIFSDGVHGLALANDVCASDKCPQYYNEQVEEWKILSDNWLRKEYNIKK